MVEVHSVNLFRKKLFIPWGFHVVGGSDLEIPLTIQRITPSSIAHLAGLRPGDGILAINGHAAEGLFHADAQDAILQSGLKLHLSVRRYPHEGYQPGYPQGLPGHVPAVVHKQYNSPLPLYSAENVAEALATQTEALTNGSVGVDFRAIGTPVLKRSEVYRMVQEEQRQTKTVQKTVSSPEPTFQSQSFIRIQRTLDETGRPISPVSPTPGSDARKAAPAVPLSGPQAHSVAEQQREPQRPQPYLQQQYHQQQPPYNRQQQPPYNQQSQPPYNQQQYRPQPSSDYNSQQAARAPPSSPVRQVEKEPVRQQQFPQQQATPARSAPQPSAYQSSPQGGPPSEYRPPQYQQQPEYRPPPQQQQEYRPPPQQQQEYRPPPQQQQEYRPPPQQQQEYRPPPQQPQPKPATSPAQQRKAAPPKHEQRPEPYRYQAAGTGYQAPPMNSVSPSGRRRPVWPPPSSVPALQTSTQSIHWIGSKGQKKFVWPPPKAYTSYEYDEAQKYREGPLSRSEAQERADNFIQPGSRSVPRSHPRAPARLAAAAWEPYSGAKAEARHPLHRRNPRRTRRFEEVITMSNSTRLPPTYRPPPGTQHIVLDYEFESEEEEEEEEEED